jgi:hypothetical protein
MKTLFALPFLISFERRTLCSYTLKTKEMDMFQRAIDEDYYFGDRTRGLGFASYVAYTISFR